MVDGSSTCKPEGSGCCYHWCGAWNCSRSGFLGYFEPWWHSYQPNPFPNNSPVPTLVLQIADWRRPWEGETSLTNFSSLSDIPCRIKGLERIWLRMIPTRASFETRTSLEPVWDSDFFWAILSFSLQKALSVAQRDGNLTGHVTSYSIRCSICTDLPQWNKTRVELIFVSPIVSFIKPRNLRGDCWAKVWF